VLSTPAFDPEKERRGDSGINDQTVAPEKSFPSVADGPDTLLARSFFRPKSPVGYLNKGAQTMATMERETTSLIGSDKVEGTTVYGIDGNSIGTIQRVMIDKVSLRRYIVRRLPRPG
jgi:hypothetical protein